MTFADAAKFACPLNRHRGEPLEAILNGDPGYLTWIEKSGMMAKWVGPFKDAFETFMAEKSVREQIERARMDRKFARQNAER